MFRYFIPIFLTTFICTQGQTIPGSFIVQIGGDCDASCRQSLQDSLDSSPDTSGCTLGDSGAKIGSLTYENVICPTSEVSAAGLREGTVASVLTGETSAASTATVQIVRQDYVVETQATPTSLWGVDEADGGVEKVKKEPVRDGLRTCSDISNNGAGVNVWVFDTGCTPANGGLCQGYYGGSNICQDNNGHGEHVGGTVSDPEFGVAPAATRSCVKVLSDSGSGSYTNVIKGISFAVENRKMFTNGDVINMSLGGPKSDAVNNAIVEARKLGIYFTLAAGNNAENACEKSPASANGRRIFTVQAHDENLKPASFTNFATKELSCTTLSAPGVSIESVNGRKSGTSMAAPHVAGACAILLSDGLKPNKKRLTANSVKIKIKGARARKTLGLVCP